MAQAQTTAQQKGATTQQDSILEQVIGATKQTERSRAEQLVSALVGEAMSGTVTWNKSLVKTIDEAVKKLDQQLSKQLAAVMHAEHFKKLEGSWRGLEYLVKNTSTSASMRIRMLQANKRELYKEMDKASDYDQSLLFKQVYDSEFGMAGGEPFGLMIGDYEFTNSNEDMELIRKVSNVAAAAFCPFVTAADSSLLGLNSWSELAKPRDLEKVQSTQEFAKWRGFRETEDSRFVTMAMPRVLARLPYGKETRPADTFDYEETGAKSTKELQHDDYCWMNAAYVLGQRITNAMTKYSWATAIRGAEGGGKVENLPLHVFRSDEGDVDAKCPTEIGITDRREAELSKLGFLPLCHYKNTDYAVFFGAQTAQKPKKYDTPAANANAEISARLPYILATSRFAHFLKVMGRDKIGSFMEAEDCEAWLNRWINQYVNANAAANQELKAKYPLAEASVQVKEVPGKPGSYNAVVHLRPWLQFEELTSSMRLVAKIPQLKQ